MAEITVQDCRGMSEKIDPKKLPEGMAQEALNIEFGHGHIKPFKQPSEATVTANLNSISGTTERIYLTQAASGWLLMTSYQSWIAQFLMIPLRGFTPQVKLPPEWRLRREFETGSQTQTYLRPIS